MRVEPSDAPRKTFPDDSGPTTIVSVSTTSPAGRRTTLVAQPADASAAAAMMQNRIISPLFSLCLFPERVHFPESHVPKRAPAFLRALLYGAEAA